MEELVRRIPGAEISDDGTITINGKEVKINNPNDSINAGIAFITEDRQQLGLMLHASVLENATILGLREKINGFFVNIKRFPALIEPLLKELRVKTPSVWTEAVYLSGGNQQKVVLAKWLYAEQDIYIFDEPTRGIDVCAKYEIYELIINMAKQGKTVIVVSSEMPEILGITNRIGVMSNGRLSGIVNTKETDQEELLRLSAKYL